MARKLLVGLLLVGVLLSVSSCSKDLTEESLLASATVSESEKPAEHSAVFFPLKDFQSQSHISTTMKAEVGERFKVVLGANPTLGFQWQENVGIDDEGIIKQMGHKFVASGTCALGSPGQDIWTFEALKKGTTIISIECSRPWEDRDLGALEITITVKVE